MSLLSRLMYLHGLSLATAALLVGVFTAAPANSQSCGGQTPCFKTNSDMLDGKRTLLPLDDVVFMRNTTGRPQLEWQVVEMGLLGPNRRKVH